MILDDIKTLIKDCEKCLIKDERFKKDYKFKNQVKIIYGLKKKETTTQIIVPVPYYNESNQTSCPKQNESSISYKQNEPHICPKPPVCPKPPNCPEPNCPVYDKSSIISFNEEEKQLEKTKNNLSELDNRFTPEEMEQIENLRLSPEELEKLFILTGEELTKELTRLQKNMNRKHLTL